MKFIANPVRVDAHQIVEVQINGTDKTGAARFLVYLDDGRTEALTPEQTARHIPEPGDYIVVQEDGYTYINPRETFERKYAPEGSQVRFGTSESVAEHVCNAAAHIRDSNEPVESAVVVYGTYGGKFYVWSTESGVTALGLLDIGKRTMQDAIIRPLID
ncbi:hypothetical protein M0D69_13945 [Caballeronia sp. SEWSISQ10-4 2]|uniref:hypothetical protein n=1 Tax=Caballeronia sp. SEWSISQ10-4 2 TaxID=2937438 RepID=UPI0026503A1A|nr:hypothetical protein [Caballeronia sp. SEWSISQ10-4 2]MDN7179096.1 hypothetical protein [Caballeronia sp. SEWSISQ10-4 2]